MSIAQKCGLLAIGVLTGTSAQAAVPEAITTAISVAQTDGSTVATAVVVLTFTIWGIKRLLMGK